MFMRSECLTTQPIFSAELISSSKSENDKLVKAEVTLSEIERVSKPNKNGSNFSQSLNLDKIFLYQQNLGIFYQVSLLLLKRIDNQIIFFYVTISEVS